MLKRFSPLGANPKEVYGMVVKEFHCFLVQVCERQRHVRKTMKVRTEGSLFELYSRDAKLRIYCILLKKVVAGVSSKLLGTNP